MKGLGKWECSAQTEKYSRLKALRKSSKGKSLLSEIGPSSGSEESATVHFVQTDLTSFSDEASESDYDPVVVRTVEMLSVAGSDTSAYKQERKARSSEGIPSR